MQACQLPLTKLAHPHLSDSKPPVRTATSVRGLLRLHTDNDHRIPELAHGGVGSIQRLHDQATRLLIAIDPLGPVKHKADWPHQREVAGRQRVQRTRIAADLGLNPSFVQAEDCLMCRDQITHFYSLDDSG